jgi:hypothetical protein
VSLTFTSLASPTDDISFSSSTTTPYAFNYTPIANANGVDPLVTRIRINPKGAFAASTSFDLRFRTRVK